MASRNSKRKKIRVLVLMMEAGSGHKIPAYAIRDCIGLKYPEATVEVYDIAHHLGCNFIDNSYKNLWKIFLKHPKIFKLAYRYFELPFVSVQKLEALITRNLKKRLHNYILNQNPDVILSTHYTSANVIGRLKKEGKIKIPDLVLISDAFNAHPLWIQGHSDYYIVSDQEPLKSSIKHSISTNQIVDMPFPLSKRFSQKRFIDMRKKHNIPASEKVVLLMSGAEGIGNLDKLAKEYEKNLSMTFFVMCGKNLKLLKKIKSFKNPKIIPLGFTTHVADYMKSSDICVGKSGISFIFESLFMRRPLLLTQWMANEEAAKDFVIQNELGWASGSIEEQIKILKLCEQDKAPYIKTKQNIVNINVKNGSAEISDFIINLA